MVRYYQDATATSDTSCKPITVGTSKQMPFFVYKISPENKLEHVETFEKYREAKLKVNELRKTEPTDSEMICRMIHATNKSNAEKLLLIPRDERIIGD